MSTEASTHSEERQEGDAYKGVIPARLATAIVRDLSAIDATRSVIAIASEWAAIVAAILLYQRLATPLLFPLAVMWIGARQHALGVLMHEATHYHLFRNRKANEVVSELLLAWPLFVTTRAYRGDHFAHHRHVNTALDPDMIRKQNAEWEFPKTPRALGLLLLKDVFGLNTYQQVMEASDMSDTDARRAGRFDGYRIARIVYYLTIAGLVVYFDVWGIVLLFWFVPALTWLKMILRIRGIAEHYSVENNHVYTRTRTTLPSIFDRMFIAPRHVNYHLEHHLYPSVPFFRLRQLHMALMQDVNFRVTAHQTRSYFGVLRECVRR